MEFLKWMFSNLWIFIGMMILISTILTLVGNIINNGYRTIINCVKLKYKHDKKLEEIKEESKCQ